MQPLVGSCWCLPLLKARLFFAHAADMSWNATGRCPSSLCFRGATVATRSHRSSTALVTCEFSTPLAWWLDFADEPACRGRFSDRVFGTRVFAVGKTLSAQIRPDITDQDPYRPDDPGNLPSGNADCEPHCFNHWGNSAGTCLITAGSAFPN